MNIPLVNATVVVVKDYGRIKEGTEYVGLWFDDQLMRYAAIPAEGGEISFLTAGNCHLRFAREGEKPIVNNVEVEDAASLGQINWLKGQVTSLSKRVKELESGNKHK